jgi:hypothetical protein
MNDDTPTERSWKLLTELVHHSPEKLTIDKYETIYKGRHFTYRMVYRTNEGITLYDKESKDRRVGIACAIIGGYGGYPIYDHIIANIMHLKNDELKWLRTANVRWFIPKDALPKTIQGRMNHSYFVIE